MDLVTGKAGALTTPRSLPIAEKVNYGRSVSGPKAHKIHAEAEATTKAVVESPNYSDDQLFPSLPLILAVTLTCPPAHPSTATVQILMKGLEVFPTEEQMSITKIQKNT